MATKKKKSPTLKKAASKAKPARTNRIALKAKKAAGNTKASRTKKTSVTRAPAKKAKMAAKKPNAQKSSAPKKEVKPQTPKPARGGPYSSTCLTKQRARLLALKDNLLDSMNGVAKDSLRSRPDGSEASAFGQHQADAGSDAYDKDFALSLLSSEQDSLYEIDQALKRIDDKTYGICEISSKTIPQARLEAIPFARYTVECQAEIEKRNRQSRIRQPITSLFGYGEEDGEDEDEDSSSDNKD